MNILFMNDWMIVVYTLYGLIFLVWTGVLVDWHLLFALYSYKILFLDVLFPLSLKKIIFVDADLVSIMIICDNVIYSSSIFSGSQCNNHNKFYIKKNTTQSVNINVTSDY